VKSGRLAQDIKKVITRTGIQTQTDRQTCKQYADILRAYIRLFGK